ncbi:MAG: hypothetical protein LBB42_01135 [Coriobacteriales bacterium]|jgi:hypothetical protein|nr:hypothetical protein [Coriobacteriales bacterium]
MTAQTVRSRAFFLELALNIVIFTFCALITMQVFIEARTLSQQSSALSHLSLEAQTTAELFKTTGGDVDALLASLENAQLANGGLMNDYADAIESFALEASTPPKTSRQEFIPVLDVPAPAGDYFIVQLYDRSLNPTNDWESAHYFLECAIDKPDALGLAKARIVVFDKKSRLYELEVCEYVGVKPELGGVA